MRRPDPGITVTADSKGECQRICAEKPDVMLPTKNGKLDVGGALSVSVFYGDQRYGDLKNRIRTDDFVSSEIAEDLTYYFATSEQVPSSVGLGVLMEKDNTVRCAGGIHHSNDAVCRGEGCPAGRKYQKKFIL